jgi:hypothetical protein
MLILQPAPPSSFLLTDELRCPYYRNVSSSYFMGHSTGIVGSHAEHLYYSEPYICASRSLDVK